jgi:hypothetical protein
MTIAARFVRCSAQFSRATIPRRIVVAIFLALAASGVADAKTGGAGYDGIWNVLIVTEAGHCDPAYRYPFRVAGGRISSAGAASVLGSVSRGGRVKLTVSAAGSVATGSGRLASRSGSGRWNARLSGGICSGHWEASRGM